MRELKLSVDISRDTGITCEHCGRDLARVRLERFNDVSEFIATCECVVARQEAEENTEQHSWKVAQLVRHSGLGERFGECTFARWDRVAGQELPQAFIEYADTWDRGSREGKGLLIYGPPGNGKSFLAAALVNKLIRRGVSAVFANVPELLSRIRYSFDGSGESEGQIIGRLLDVNLLVLDDLAAHKSTEWSESLLFTLIDSRYRRKLPVVITCNVTPLELRGIIGERTMSRLDETCTILNNRAGDYRRRKSVSHAAQR